MHPVFVKLFGDSIIGRVVQDGPEGRYRRLDPVVKLEDNDIDLNLVNVGRFGYTIEKAEKLIEKQLKNDEQTQVMLLEYGGNDCNYDWQKLSDDIDGEHMPGTPLNVFRKTYIRIIEKLRAHNIMPIIMNLPPIDAEKFFATWIAPLPAADKILSWLGDKQKIYRWHELYSNEAERIAQETGTLFIDVRSAFLMRRDFPDLIGPDGMHPTEKGYEVLSQALRSFVRNIDSATKAKLLPQLG